MEVQEEEEEEEQPRTTLLIFVSPKVIVLASDFKGTPVEGDAQVFIKINKLKRSSNGDLGISMCGDSVHGNKLRKALQSHMEKLGNLEVLDCARHLVHLDRRAEVNRRTHFFLAGFDLNEGNELQPQAYFVNRSGLINIVKTNLKIARNSFWLGSGGRYAFMHFHGRFRPDMTAEELVDLAENSVYFASTKCPHTDFGVQVMILEPAKDIETITLSQKEAEEKYLRWLEKEKKQLGKYD